MDAGDLQKHCSGPSSCERQQFRTCPYAVIIGDEGVGPQDDQGYSRTHAVDKEVSADPGSKAIRREHRPRRLRSPELNRRLRFFGDRVELSLTPPSRCIKRSTATGWIVSGRVSAEVSVRLYRKR